MLLPAATAGTLSVLCPDLVLRHQATVAQGHDPRSQTPYFGGFCAKLDTDLSPGA